MTPVHPETSENDNYRGRFEQMCYNDNVQNLQEPIMYGVGSIVHDNEPFFGLSHFSTLEQSDEGGIRMYKTNNLQTDKIRKFRKVWDDMINKSAVDMEIFIKLFSPSKLHLLRLNVPKIEKLFDLSRFYHQIRTNAIMISLKGNLMRDITGDKESSDNFFAVDHTPLSSTLGYQKPKKPLSRIATIQGYLKLPTKLTINALKLSILAEQKFKEEKAELESEAQREGLAEECFDMRRSTIGALILDTLHKYYSIKGSLHLLGHVKLEIFNSNVIKDRESNRLLEMTATSLTNLHKSQMAMLEIMFERISVVFFNCSVAEDTNMEAMNKRIMDDLKEWAEEAINFSKDRNRKKDVSEFMHNSFLPDPEKEHGRNVRLVYYLTSVPWIFEQCGKRGKETETREQIGPYFPNLLEQVVLNTIAVLKMELPYISPDASKIGWLRILRDRLHIELFHYNISNTHNGDDIRKEDPDTLEEWGNILSRAAHQELTDRLMKRRKDFKKPEPTDEEGKYISVEGVFWYTYQLNDDVPETKVPEAVSEAVSESDSEHSRKEQPGALAKVEQLTGALDKMKVQRDKRNSSPTPPTQLQRRPQEPTIDPALLTVADRKALFKQKMVKPTAHAGAKADE